MRKHMKLVSLALVFMLGATSAAFSQQVRFAVNMEHMNLEPGDLVVVRGNKARLGNWNEQGELVLNQVRNSTIYGKRTRLNLENGEVLFKYVIKKADGTEIWEQTGNRVLDPQQTEPVWFSDRNTPGITQTFVNVSVRLDLSQHTMDGVAAQGVALMGMHAPLSFEPENGKTHMMQLADGIWETTVAFPFGTPHDVPFKFMFLNDDEWVWEWRAGHTNHVFWIDDSSTELTVSLVYDNERPGIIPIDYTEGAVDDYSAIISNLGETGTSSRYVYELAMEQLRAGNREAAQATYAEYKKAHPGGEEVDDFSYEMAYHIQRNEGTPAAEHYVDQEINNEPNAERKSYLRYLRGELALRNGEQTKARRLLRRALRDSEWDIANEYSQRAIIQSYLIDQQADSVGTGLAMLENLVERTHGQRRQQLARMLLQQYDQREMWREKETLLQRFMTEGTGRRQLRIRLELAKTYLKQGRQTEALGMLDSIEFYENVPRPLLLQVMKAKIPAYYELEMYNEVALSYQEYSQQWPEDPYVHRLGILNDKSLEQLGGIVTPEPQLDTTPDDGDE